MSAHRSNHRNDRNHRNIYPTVDTSPSSCRETQKLCMDEPARWDLIIKRCKRRYHIGWSSVMVGERERKIIILWKTNLVEHYSHVTSNMRICCVNDADDDDYGASPDECMLGRVVIALQLILTPFLSTAATYRLAELKLNGAWTHNYKLIINYYDYSINFTRLYAFKWIFCQLAHTVATVVA